VEGSLRLVDQQELDVAAGEVDRQGQTGRSGPADQYSVMAVRIWIEV
jgi:hypothetical protein